jgi:hypothetical protein
MAHSTVDGRIYDLDKLSEPPRQQANEHRDRGQGSLE